MTKWELPDKQGYFQKSFPFSQKYYKYVRKRLVLITEKRIVRITLRGLSNNKKNYFLNFKIEFVAAPKFRAYQKTRMCQRHLMKMGKSIFSRWNFQGKVRHVTHKIHTYSTMRTIWEMPRKIEFSVVYATSKLSNIF